MSFVRALFLFVSTCVVACADESATPNGVRDEVVNSVGMRLVPIAAGEFAMGSPESEPGRRADRERRHYVRVSAFYLGRFEVTQAQFAKVTGENPSYFSAERLGADRVRDLDTSDFPVDSVAWQAAVDFCRTLSDLPEERAAGRTYRLPTEAEWEYACRAGTTTAFYFGDDASALANHAFIARNSGRRPHPVGEKSPNPQGLHDLYGNLWEWCSDGFADDYGLPVGHDSDEAIVDPQGAADPTHRVIRGGAFASEVPARLRSAARNFDPPHIADSDTGFRVVMTQAEEAAP